MNNLKRAEQIVEGAFDLVSLPELYFRVDEMISDPRYTADDIGELIISDPAMTAKLLKIVNSAFYGFPAKIETLTRAITVIGLAELKALILASSAIQKFHKIPHDLMDMNLFWKHSINCGIIAKTLAQKGGVLHAERLFILGLLHELGTLLMYNKLADESRDILLTADGDRRLVPYLEQELLGFTHADVTALILNKWELSSSMVEATKYHLQPEKALEASLEAHLLYLANILCGVDENGDSIEKALAEIPAETWAITGLVEGDVLMAIDESVEQLSPLFSLMTS